MKKIVILLFLILILAGCNPEKKSEDKNTEQDSTALTSQDSVKNTLKSLQSFYYEPLGDTVYVELEFENAQNPKTNEAGEREKYFIISSYSSYKYDSKLQAEIKRWKELEPDSYLESYGKKSVRKYYISLGKYKTQAEIIPIFKEFQAKYPNENINFYNIVQ